MELIVFPPLAHQAACKAGYLHGDISAGNILLYVNERGQCRGLLNDWELAKEFDIMDGSQDTCRQLGRTVSSSHSNDITHFMNTFRPGNLAIPFGARA